ncbi:MAG TPA: ABC transporter permease subunit [Chitinophagaceae bacterium]|nr:ABC transporter permease subunit [Chitinophagaceae bacterium]
MWILLKIELFKIFKRPRTYIAFGAIAAIVVLIQVALKYDGKSYIDLLLSNLDNAFEMTDEFKDKMLNGFLICFIILNTLLIQMPLLVALIAGDSIAGEANMGTLRLSLTKPVSRTQYMLVKFLASILYTFALLLWMALLALLGSVLLFGVNDMVIMRSRGLEVIEQFDIWWRYIAAFGYAAVALTTVSALAFLLSVFADNAIGPIIATMSIVIVFTILSEMNIPIYDRTIKPYLFTSHMVAWKGFFYMKADSEGTTLRGTIENLPAILRSLGILVTYIVIFFGAAVWVFRKKDILT